ncbi:MAG: hypothetical protein II333_07300, partial [Clostridia bacterium]|nr:hypothetical protein [Clostridia bacterium]
MAEGRTLSDIFKKTAPLVSGGHLEIFETAREVTVKINREQRIAEVGCFLPRLYSKKEIYSLEALIRETYELTQVRILTHYDPSLFSEAYMGEILTEAARVGIVINGFFNKYELRTEGDTITMFIPFTHGGLTLLQLAQTAEVIAGIIRSEFGLNYKVEIKQSRDAEEEYAEFMAQQLQKLNSRSAAIIADHERLEAEAAAKADPVHAVVEAAEEEKAVLPRVASLFEGESTPETVSEGVIK